MLAGSFIVHVLAIVLTSSQTILVSFIIFSLLSFSGYDYRLLINSQCFEAFKYYQFRMSVHEVLIGLL
jgi:hypothetical protein